MAAYLHDLTPERCQSCGKPGKVELRNASNCRVGVYCRGCGKRRLAALTREETRK